MALDLEEQEQVDALKAWWKQHGNKVIVAIVLFAGGMFAWNGWQHYQAKQSAEASVLFDAMRRELASNNTKQIRAIAGQLIDKYPRTVYATDAAMYAAKVNFDSGDTKSAKAQYQWVIDHAKQTQSRDLARMRLAVVLMDEKNYVEAMKLLEAKHDPAFDALYLDLKGDVYAIQGKASEAHGAYQAAINALPKETPFKDFVRIKLDALGDQG